MNEAQAAEETMSDSERLDWLERHPEKWLDVRDAFHGGEFYDKGLRAAIDQAIEKEKQ